MNNRNTLPVQLSPAGLAVNQHKILGYIKRFHRLEDAHDDRYDDELGRMHVTDYLLQALHRGMLLPGLDSADDEEFTEQLCIHVYGAELWDGHALQPPGDQPEIYAPLQERPKLIGAVWEDAEVVWDSSPTHSATLAYLYIVTLPGLLRA